MPHPQKKIAVYAFTPQGLDLALFLSEKTGARIHAPESLKALADTAKGGIRFFSRLSTLMRDVFNTYDCHIFVSAAGIAVRAIAPHIVSKMHDPAVLVIDQQARHVVSLLSGHAGGANRLAADLAALTGATLVVSTATDLEGLPGIDLLAKERGLAIADCGGIKKVSAALLRGERPALYDPGNFLNAREEPWGEYFDSLASGPAKDEFEALRAALDAHKGVCVVVSEYTLPKHAMNRCLLLHPPSVCVGVGCKKGCPAEAILGFVREIFAGQRLSLSSIACLASIDAKKDEPGLLEAAAALARPLLLFSPAELQKYPTSSPSPKAREVFGIPAVAEPAAYAAAHKQSAGAATLLTPKRKGTGMTLALVRIGGGA